ncbi:MAG: MmcQ/YjbR family DNA-binding protein [Chloroflexi bacterium]|nr:MmcQ/YjbR family DNA-binding protein [Chloroflexota bacterium]
MTGAVLRRYCLAKPGAVAEYPFGPGARVYKVAGKMFALIPDDPPLRISLKCDPALAEILREQFPAVRPGYHFNKRHWNTVDVDGSIHDGLVREWVDHSYDLAVSALPRAIREALPGPGARRASEGRRPFGRAPR